MIKFEDLIFTIKPVKISRYEFQILAVKQNDPTWAHRTLNFKIF